MLKLKFSVISVFILRVVLFAAAGDVSAQTFFFGGEPGYQETFSFDKYNGSDILDSVEIILSLDITGGEVIVDNDAPSNTFAMVFLGASAGISSTDVALLNDIGYLSVVDVSIFVGGMLNLYPDDGDGAGNFDAVGLDAKTYLGGTASDLNRGFIDTAALSEYQGPGSYNIQLDVGEIFNIMGGTNLESDSSPVATVGSLEVIYTTSSVPEPGTIALLCSGLALLRRRK